MGAITFTSRLDSSYLRALQDLVFFNPQQSYVRSGIIEAIAAYGQPRIQEENGGVRLEVEPYTSVQALFALVQGEEGEAPRLVGMAMYARVDQENILLLHLAVDPDYASTGAHAPEMLAMHLIVQLRTLARRLRGCRWITIVYSGESTSKIPI